MRVTYSPQDVVELTPTWTGDRSRDGRPHVSDAVLEVLKAATVEHVWHVLTENGFGPHFVGGFRRTHEDRVLVGRCLTAQFLPLRPDLDAVVRAAGTSLGWPPDSQQNTWAVESLETGDVLVADIFGKVREGTVLGDNLGTAVAQRTGVGAIIDGGVRDLAGLVQVPAPVNFFYRDADPTPIADVTLAGINLPIRIGDVTVLPGDVALGTPSGVAFIPAQLAEAVARQSRDIGDRDRFAKQRLGERRYTSAEIDVHVWPAHIEGDYQEWLAAESVAQP